MRSINWEKIWPEAGRGRYDKENNIFEICSPHVLTQLIGYAKFFFRKDGVVLFRGQTKNHKSMIPSLFRESPSLSSVGHKQEILDNYIKRMIDNRAFLKRTESIAYEALLQHYGIKTRWLDLVDNIWIALWFATHEANSIGRASKYMHYEVSSNDFSYIFIMHFGRHTQNICQRTRTKLASFCKRENNFDKLIKLPIHGFFETESYQIIDLRCMTPSLYRRPHSQHAILARRKSFSDMSHINYNDAVVCTLKIETELALKRMSGIHLAMPVFSKGYRPKQGKAVP